MSEAKRIVRHGIGRPAEEQEYWQYWIDRHYVEDIPGEGPTCSRCLLPAAAIIAGGWSMCPGDPLQREEFLEEQARRVEQALEVRGIQASSPGEPGYAGWLSHVLPYGWSLSMRGDGLTYGRESSGYEFWERVRVW